MVAPHVGGAFGGKAGITFTHGAIVGAARALGRPVAWTETRSEAMLSMHGRAAVQFAEARTHPRRPITGLRARNIGDCGAYAGFGGTLVVGPGHIMAQGPYEIPKIDYSAIAAMTNTAPNGAFRGAGRPEAAAMLERLMYLAAVELGLSPEEIRRRNLIPKDAFPYKTLTGMTYDVGGYEAALQEALRLAGVDALRTEQARRIEAGEEKLLGIGVSTYVEITGFGGKELGSVLIEPDGSATVMSGTSAHGQGHATSFAMIVADRLGIPIEQIRYVQSDTRVVPTGGGTGGSRSLAARWQRRRGRRGGCPRPGPRARSPAARGGAGGPRPDRRRVHRLRRTRRGRRLASPRGGRRGARHPAARAAQRAPGRRDVPLRRARVGR